MHRILPASAVSLLALALVAFEGAMAGQPGLGTRQAAASRSASDRDAAPPAPAGPRFRQTKEWQALNRYVGTWDDEMTVTVPEPKQVRLSHTIAWTLGDRFLQVKAKGDDNSEWMALHTYDPGRRAMRAWWFSSLGFTAAFTGSWDEATRTYTLRADDAAPGSSTVTDRFIDDNHREWKVVTKDPEGKVVYEMSGKATRQKRPAEKPAPDQVPADVPPETAAGTANRIVALLKAGDAAAAAGHFLSSPGMDAVEALKKASEELKRGETTPALEDSREDGDLAVIIWKVVRQGKGGMAATYEPNSMVRKEGTWRICPDLRVAKVSKDDGERVVSRSHNTIGLEGADKERMDALWKWAMGRCQELNKDSRKPGVPNTAPAKPVSPPKAPPSPREAIQGGAKAPTTPPAGAAEAAKSAEAAWQGTWVGREAKSPPPDRWSFTVQGNQVELKGSNGRWAKGKLTLRPKASPKQVDLLFQECSEDQCVGQTVPGIYEFGGDGTLTWAMGEPGAERRPQSFERKGTVDVVVFRPARPEDLGAPPAALEGPAAQSPEQRVLDQMLGTWRYEATVLKEDGPPQAKPRASRYTCTRVLGGHFVQENHEDAENTHLMLYTYDPQRKRYRAWSFSSMGLAIEAEGKWDADARSFTWVSPPRDGQTLTYQLRFAGNEKAESSLAVKDNAGKAVFRAEAKHIRLKAPKEGDPVQAAVEQITAVSAAPHTRLKAPKELALVQAAVLQIAVVSSALVMFELDCGRFPRTPEGLDALIHSPPGLEGWKGPYLKGPLPKDPWGNPYRYSCPGKHNADGYDVSSFGPDGRDGSGDDINNWTQRSQGPVGTPGRSQP